MSMNEGVEKLVQSQNEQQRALLEDQRIATKHKIDSILLSNAVLKSDEVRQACHKIDSLDNDEREAYITETWGPLFWEKVQPLVHQLNTIDEALAK